VTDNEKDSGKAALSRREILGLAAGATVGAAMYATPGQSAERGANDIVLMDAAVLSKAIHSRKVSCVEVMSAYLEHIERINPKVIAIVALQERADLLIQARERDAQLARGESSGPLHGFPHAVKDLQAVKGIRMTLGTPILKALFLRPTD
jgi:amidase